MFRRISGCSVEQKTLGILLRTIPTGNKMLGILYRGIKIDANSRNSIPNHSAEEKTTRNSFPWNRNRSQCFHINKNNKIFPATERIFLKAKLGCLPWLNLSFPLILSVCSALINQTVVTLSICIIK